MKKRTSPKKCLSRQEKFGDSPFLGSLFSLFFLCSLCVCRARYLIINKDLHFLGDNDIVELFTSISYVVLGF